MNGIIREKLIENLKIMRRVLCAYESEDGNKCDCKFINESTSKPCRKSENGPGCPELYEAIILLESLTDKQFNTLRKKAKLSVFELDQKQDEINKKRKYTKLLKKTKKDHYQILEEKIVNKIYNKIKEELLQKETYPMGQGFTNI